MIHGPNEADVDINTKNSLDNSGSNEILQNALALALEDFVFFIFKNFENLGVFSSDLGKICFGEGRMGLGRTYLTR